MISIRNQHGQADVCANAPTIGSDARLIGSSHRLLEGGQFYLQTGAVNFVFGRPEAFPLIPFRMNNEHRAIFSALYAPNSNNLPYFG